MSITNLYLLTMEFITVRTTQNIDIEYEIGGLGERILAYFIDLGVFVALAIVGGIFITKIFPGGAQIFFIVLGILLLFYDLLCEVFLNGQSAGKIVMKIRVISLDGNRPKFSQYLLRWLFRIVDFSVTSWLGGSVSIIVTDKSQRIGDLVAGTSVIRTKPRTQMNNITFVPTEDTYEPVFLQVSQLRDEDIALVYEVIESYFKTGSNLAVYKMADRIRELLAINLPPDMNSMQFLQTVIKDYSHITAQTSSL
jgi:uncharacterized RDD family membrane protein YckC